MPEAGVAYELKGGSLQPTEDGKDILVDGGEYGTVIYHADGRCHVYMPEGQNADPDTPRGRRPGNKAGFLWKKAGNMNPSSPRVGYRRNWNKRWFTLNGPVLSYYEAPGNDGEKFGPGVSASRRRNARAVLLPLCTALFFSLQARARPSIVEISASPSGTPTAIS